MTRGRSTKTKAKSGRANAIELTPALARAASLDAANRHMRRNGRRAWDESDFNVACLTLAGLAPPETSGS
jgi:hypothetical protein